MGSVTTKSMANGLQYVEVDTELCQARIFLQGAQIDQFQPKGQSPLLWVSAADDYQVGNGIRGGIPICWPWFGQSEIADFPQHGFARTRTWSLSSVNMQNQLAIITLSLPINHADKQYWPHDTQLKVVFELGTRLKVSLVNTNNADYPVQLTQALHTYFPTSDIHNTQVDGLAGSQYIEFGQGPFKQPHNQVAFTKETDRVYTNLQPQQIISTPEGNIIVNRDNSHSAVLWNPWIAKSQRLSRFNDNDYLSMLCLEAANVLDDKVLLQPGDSHTLITEIFWQDEVN
ncbi:D-hexose-6-phosphate mutarotase [Shewanella intestini]|uniref:Putative glucose-6-phosphate 1-epimerase n=1 Tax=Shewanella intestini TaxID=2017544 RepID=A0ABS5I1B3_9GAMM|nr:MULTISPECIES: D-hexose-6-phosphate mutarotase [Shewanella]MBR9727802.1 D-hexose-6-phosphate mutarotase [Shewanella intestini]MRG36205.1 D-hexose-6-phosphate mutarotase [Shewanella sp. XMDDZSB0408]